MCQVEGEDLIRALKRFKSLAKQDLLASERTNDPSFWRTHAEARRKEYTRLIQLVENSGVEKACVYALKTYKRNRLINTKERNPEQEGTRQALELFFEIIGCSPGRLGKWLQERNVEWEGPDVLFEPEARLVQEQL
ncbi:MAG TPA: hypothetical protein GXX33_05620 [Firmicutes bacterium]|uniref:Uncharacterized protein n=1 Tax=Capillibacterium thermochitinicola TaxID=2699427 RepID=A0A8J6I063_9FIRM|nr:hypothetical protein [Capillibacterium thermochitinicola]MBA2133300.1 hypothetical protein [Capillibacterium thermochitinicola]HHW12462.1 hypothetical protein [Bacillota bacterium]